MDRFARNFGTKVKELRISRGFTQTQLSTLAVVGANYVPRIERGEMTPSVDAAYRIAQALGVSIDDLCAGNERRDSIRDAARAIASLTDADVTGFKRVTKAVEDLRSKLRAPSRESNGGRKRRSNGKSARSPG